MEYALAVAAIVLAYLVGAFPTGLIVGRAWNGTDLRTVGSKNIGFTNAWRVLGTVPGLIVLGIDCGKAYAGALMLPWLVSASWSWWLPMAVAAALMLGNMVNVFLKGGGGKGIASGLGVFMALSPLAMTSGFVVWAVLLATTRYMSLASVCGAATLGATAFVFYPWYVAVVVAAASAAAIYKHKTNIQRLIAGTEPKFGRAGSAQTPAAPPPNAA